MNRTDISMQAIDGSEVDFARFDGQYLLVVNVASR